MELLDTVSAEDYFFRGLTQFHGYVVRNIAVEVAVVAGVLEFVAEHNQVVHASLQIHSVSSSVIVIGPEEIVVIRRETMVVTGVGEGLADGRNPVDVGICGRNIGDAFPQAAIKPLPTVHGVPFGSVYPGRCIGHGETKPVVQFLVAERPEVLQNDIAVRGLLTDCGGNILGITQVVSDIVRDCTALYYAGVAVASHGMVETAVLKDNLVVSAFIDSILREDDALEVVPESHRALEVDADVGLVASCAADLLKEERTGENEGVTVAYLHYLHAVLDGRSVGISCNYTAHPGRRRCHDEHLCSGSPHEGAAVAVERSHRANAHFHEIVLNLIRKGEAGDESAVVVGRKMQDVEGIFGLSVLFRINAEDWSCASANYVAGIYGGGYSSDTKAITDCTNTGSITVDSGSMLHVGGIAGAMRGAIKGIVQNANITVSGSGLCKVGGLMGYYYAGTVQQSTNRGNSISGNVTTTITPSADNGDEIDDENGCTGGIVGMIYAYAKSGSNGTLKDITINTHTTASAGHAGALIGRIAKVDGNDAAYTVTLASNTYTGTTINENAIIESNVCGKKGTGSISGFVAP